MTRVPVEILDGVLELYVVVHIDEMVGPRAQAIEDEEDDDTGTASRIVVSQPILSCLLVSYQFRQITLGVLSKYFVIPLDVPNARLESSPWPRLAAVRAFVLTGLRTGMIVAELMSIARTSPTLGVYVWVKAALHQLSVAPKTYDVATLDVDGLKFWNATVQWDDAVQAASAACEQVPLAPSMIQPLLLRHAHHTLPKATLAQKYGRLLTTLVRNVQALHAARQLDLESSEDNPQFLSRYWPRLLPKLRQMEEETLFERKQERSEDMMMPETHTIIDLCTLLQKVIDMDAPASEAYDACHALSCSLKDDFQLQLSRMSLAAQPAQLSV
ncbi:hypothetical protein PsYK624_118360 [Phanerochaete sordida]|uniref:Uncharacterized protein n=1 Tax=Phanerochaete sordida TaxID=48140 RepID=A0A9P3LHS8_9APHY|nr:hypothetical protein PsYK624_118360 [Phanerochaete sordida]